MRTITIVSGKGGTGKTTVSALLAYLAAGETRAVVADCDVEASNLPLVLRVAPTTREPVAGMSRPVVDVDRCLGCGECVDACRFDAMTVAEHAVIDPWSCESCGGCVDACPVAAIGTEPCMVGEVIAGSGPTGVVVSARLLPGEDHSGKLVTAVRTRAMGAARANGADLVLVDGPPGVGCPVIAAITGADQVVAVVEPSVSGEHDLRRVVALVEEMGVAVVVVLNKADLSDAGAHRIRAACAELGVVLIGEIPFDSAVLPTLEAVARGATEPGALRRLAVADPVQSIWQQVRSAPAAMMT